MIRDLLNYWRNNPPIYKTCNKNKRGMAMLRMEIALFLVMGFIACVYFSAGRKGTPLHMSIPRKTEHLDRSS